MAASVDADSKETVSTLVPWWLRRRDCAVAAAVAAAAAATAASFLPALMSLAAVLTTSPNMPNSRLWLPMLAVNTCSERDARVFTAVTQQ
jgi:hypothetical protein